MVYYDESGEGTLPNSGRVSMSAVDFLHAAIIDDALVEARPPLPYRKGGRAVVSGTGTTNPAGFARLSDGFGGWGGDREWLTPVGGWQVAGGRWRVG